MLLDKTIRRFRAADSQTRLEALLDYSRKLRDPSPELVMTIDREGARVSECQTPVFLWLTFANGHLRFDADVPRESPTVRGFVSLLQHHLDNATAAEVQQVPDDLLDQLGLTETLGMMRTQGLTAIVQRIKRAAATARE